MPANVTPPPWVGRIYISSNYGLGFVENYWVNGADVDAANNALIAIMNARIELFDSNCWVSDIIVSAGDLKGDTLTSPFFKTKLGKYGVGAPPVVDMCHPNVALRLRMQYEDRYHATRWLRLIPEEIVTNGQKVAVQAWDDKFTLFKDALVANTSGVFKDRVNVGPPQPYVKKGLIGVTIMRVTSHRTGRPFGMPKARSVLR
jgi:hypothetical protein